MRLSRLDMNFAKLNVKPEQIRFHACVLNCPEEDLIDLSENQDRSIVFYYNKNTKTAEVTTQNEEVGILAPVSCEHLFDFARQLKHIEFNNFYISETTCLTGLFRYMDSLQTVTFLSKMEAPNLINIDEMFLGCTNLREIKGLEKLDLTHVKSAKKMFAWCEKLGELDFTRYRMPVCEYVTYLAYGCVSLKRLVIFKEDTAHIKDAVGMLELCSNIKIEIVDFGKNGKAISKEFLSFMSEHEDGRYGYLPPERIGIRAIEDSLYVVPSTSFGRIWHENKEKLQNIKQITFCNKILPKGIQALDYSAEGNGSVLGWIENKTELIISSAENTSIIAPLDCQRIFEPCYNVEEIRFFNFDTTRTKSFAKMFYYLDRLKHVEMPFLQTQHVVTMESMFEGCINLEKITGLKTLNTVNVENYSYMFKHCHAVRDIDISGFQKQIKANVREMISNCPSLELLDMTGWTFDHQFLPIIKDFVSCCPNLISEDIKWEQRNNLEIEVRQALFGNMTKLPHPTTKLTEIKRTREKEMLDRYQQKKAKRKDT